MTGALMMLFDDFAYDGRARRMHELAARFGPVRVLDLPWYDSVAGPTSTALGTGSVPRRHLAFWRAVIGEARRVRPRTIFAQNFFTAFPGWLAARATGAKLVYDAYELIIPECGARGSVRDHVWSQLERLVASRADLIVAASPERAEFMGEHYRLPRPPTSMRNIADAQVVMECEKASVLADYPALRRRDAADTILIYQGYVALDRGIGRFVELLDLLPLTYRLIVAGDGPELAELKAAAARHTIAGRFAALGPVPHDRLPAITAQADIGIVSYPWTGRNNRLCASGKFFEYAQAGLPIIASDQSPLRALCADYGAAHTFGPETSLAELAEAVTDLAARRGEAIGCSQAFLQTHGHAAEAQRVLAQLERL